MRVLQPTWGGRSLLRNMEFTRKLKGLRATFDDSFRG